MPDLEHEEHSGNTFGMACMLARFYVEKPELLPNYHGALCPLVGCEKYGCWSSRQDELPIDG